MICDSVRRVRCRGEDQKDIVAKAKEVTRRGNSRVDAKNAVRARDSSVTSISNGEAQPPAHTVP